MSHIIAAVQGAADEPAVAGVAAAFEQVLRSPVRRLDLPAGASSDQSARLVLTALEDPSALLAVLTAERSSHATCWAVMQRAAKAIVLVPPDAPRAAETIGRVLVPLDGTPESAAAVSRTVDLLANAGVDLVALHVFDADTVPRFWDQPAHAAPAFTAEFLARNVPPTGARLELRSGSAGEHIVDVAAAEGADLIALGWSQHLDPGRARTVRRCVQDSTVPTMLIPVSDQQATMVTNG
jgi:nucleotide-binding universal stress UspA family protein